MTETLGGHPDSNKRWEDLVSEHLFQPLGMEKSTFATRIDFNRDDLAAGYSELDGPEIMTPVSPELSRRWADLCASGSIMSSVKEMAHWLNFHLSGGKNATGHQVMDETLVEELHKPRLALRSLKYLGIERPEFPVTVMETAYAMGLRVGHYRGYPLIAHTGGTYGYGTYMIMLPTEKIGAIILTTGRDPSFRQRAAVAHYLVDNALNVEPYLGEDTICTFPKPWVNKDLTPSYRPARSNHSLDFEIEEYEGMYSDKAFGNLEVEYNATLQSLVIHYGWGDWEMLVWPDTANTEKTEQRLFGKAMGPNFPPDMKPFYFIEHPDTKGTVIGVKGTAFEKNRPPIFCKEEHKDVCEELKAETYPKEESLCTSNSAITAGIEKAKLSINIALLILFVFANLLH